MYKCSKDCCPLTWTNQVVSILQVWLDWCGFFLNNSYEIIVNQICLLKCAEIYIENYVDATLYVLGKQSWTIISSHWNTIVLLYSEIRCLHPNDPNLKTSPSSKWFGDSSQYECNEGFTQTANQARCTENGWTPNPLCEGIFMGDFYLYVNI